MKTTLHIRTILVLLFFLLAGVLNAQNGTADGVYNFSALGAPNSAGAGFKTQGDKFKVSNIFAQDRKTMYADNANPGETQTILIKAEGTTKNRTFTLKDLVLRNYGLSTSFDVFTVTLRNYFGATIARLALTGEQLLTTSVQAISTFDFDTPFPASGFAGVAEIQVDFHYADPSVSPDELTFWSISLANISNAIPLPLSLLDFSAKKEGSGVRINWTTANEVNVDKQIVEHSVDGLSFTPVAGFSGQKNSTVKTAYTYFHAMPAAGKNYYRLKEVDADGAEKIFVVRTVDFGKNESIAVKSANPVHGSVLVQGLSAGAYELNLVDMSGRSVVSAKLSNVSGDYRFIVPPTVPKGTYLLVIAGEAQRFSQKLVVQ